MLAHRVGLSAVRRAALTPGNGFPQAVAASLMQTRSSTTTIKMTQDEAQAQLAAQRLRRPVSPHLEIYKMEQTWFGASAWQRITGAGLGAGLYGFSLLYLVAPLAGLHLGSASIAGFVAGLPLVLKGGVKFFLAWPFAFHALNGVRHLVMDLGYGFSKQTIFTGGWGVWGLSVVSGLALVMFY